MTEEIKLTVQPSGKKSNYIYRLGISTRDSRIFFKERGKKVNLTLEEGLENIKVETTCGEINFDCGSLVRKKGYDLTKDEINEWIIQKKFNCYHPWKPTKLLFELDTNGNVDETPFKLKFLEKVV